MEKKKEKLLRVRQSAKENRKEGRIVKKEEIYPV